jgi:hypothetical protein
MDVSPFTHVPRLPAGAVSATPLLWLTAVALALTAAGLAGFRRRDLAVRAGNAGPRERPRPRTGSLTRNRQTTKVLP